MRKTSARTARIRQFIVEHVAANPRTIARLTAAKFKVSVQAVQHHLNEMVEFGVLESTGKTRARQYSLRQLVSTRAEIKLEPGIQEHVVWENQIRPALGDDIPTNVLQIASYGFTEMFNNVIDHSESQVAFVSCSKTATTISMRVYDSGIGIFKKIMDALKLPNEVEAIWELVKGKFTTDPTRHSGEGVFFTSRMFDNFSLSSGSLFFLHTQPDSDWLIERLSTPCMGTLVNMEISLNSKRMLKDVFEQFASSEEHGFAFEKTLVPLQLMQYGHENLVSRSQAKRLINRFDRFVEIILDFRGVTSIGQGFADEVFRVFQAEHRNVKLVPINMNDEVMGMIERARRAFAEQELRAE